MSEENKNDFYGETNSRKSEDNVELQEINFNEDNTVCFADDLNAMSANRNEEADDIKKTVEPKKPKRKISLKAFVLAVIATFVAAVMLMYSICSALYQSMYAKAYVDANENSFVNNGNGGAQISELDIVADIFEQYSYNSDIDSEKYMDLVIDAYIAQTGDIYAVYYTEEEYKAIENANVGKTAGVGISVINSKLTYNGEEILALKITDLVPDAPAEVEGALIGDYVYAVVTENGDVKINDVGYDEGLNILLGEEGTIAKFKVLRAKDGGFEDILFEIERKQIISRSVRGRVSAADSTVGILHIKEFDYTTPAQFVEEITKLQAKGCTKFVLDLRYNLGGKIVSAGALLSYFLNEGDVYIRTKDREGNIVNEVVGVISEFEGDRAGCNVKKEEIGMYKDLDVVVLCNESTASAAELFVANFKDYNLGKVIGTNTFGKGTLQTPYRMDSYALLKYGVSGITGVVKLTTHEYLPPKSGSYDGIGIAPDVEVPMSEAMTKINIYDYALYDPIDDQLNKAINILNNK